MVYAATDGLLLVDPLVPDHLWPHLDELVESHGQPVHVVTTLAFHRRDRDQVATRYGASTSRARDRLPDGVVPIPIRGAGETMVWLPAPRALVPGDRLLGDERGGLRLCPQSWLRYLRSDLTGAGLREALLPLLELPIELVLVSHGEPVLRDGRAALERALG